MENDDEKSNLTPEQQDLAQRVMLLLQDGYITHRDAALGLAMAVQELVLRCVDCKTLQQRCDKCYSLLIKVSAYATYDLATKQQIMHCYKQAEKLGLNLGKPKTKFDS